MKNFPKDTTSATSTKEYANNNKENICYIAKNKNPLKATRIF
jgi:hypothetical protein